MCSVSHIIYYGYSVGEQLENLILSNKFSFSCIDCYSLGGNFICSFPPD